MKNIFADLHIHTSFSDGTFTPQEILKQAEKLGISCIALTDHDCIDGIALALAQAPNFSIEVIPAVELSAEINNAEVHLLGYLIDYKQEWFNKKLKIICQIRQERMYKMVEKLKALGIEIDPQEVLALSGKGSVGRLHIAQVLLKAGYIKTIHEAFRSYIGNRCPCYVNRFKLLPREAIEMIKQINGIPVLAHPYSMNNDSLIIELIKDGLCGIEVYHPDHSSRIVTNYLEIVKKYDLLITGGSDCHGLGRGKVLLGSIKIPYELVERLKEKRAAIYGA